MRRKICVATGTRAEFGLLYWLLKEIEADSNLELQILVTGMHLSSAYGETYKVIEEAGFHISKKVEMPMDSDKAVDISKSMGIAQIGFSEALSDLNPDILVILGDRYEMFSVAASAMVLRIPIAHIHGGEATEGLIDEPIRHSITKMSHIHFTATEEYRNRVIQLGEHPRTVHNVGTPGLDNLDKLELLSKSDFEESIDFILGHKNLLVTFHPITLEEGTAEVQFKNLLNALDSLDETKIIFTKPNSDSGGKVIIRLIDEYVSKNQSKACSHISLGQLRYLSALQYMDAVVGNSSSGLTEAPSFNIATINIGDRQKGRIKSESVIDCETDTESVIKAMQLAYSSDFQEKLKGVENLYGEGGASKRIKEVLADVHLEGIIKKSFYNLEID
mgnify:CR=1 FL=1